MVDDDKWHRADFALTLWPSGAPTMYTISPSITIGYDEIPETTYSVSTSIFDSFAPVVPIIAGGEQRENNDKSQQSDDSTGRVRSSRNDIWTTITVNFKYRLLCSPVKWFGSLCAHLHSPPQRTTTSISSMQNFNLSLRVTTTSSTSKSTTPLSRMVTDESSGYKSQCFVMTSTLLLLGASLNSCHCHLLLTPEQRSL